jgi:hypothetical protein
VEADAFLQALEATLTPQVAALGGTLSIHGHEADAVSRLQIGTARWRVCLICGQEDVSAQDDGLQQAGVVTFTLRALIQHNEGPHFVPGSSLHKQGVGPHAVPLLKRCTQFRLLLLRCQFVRGTPPVPADDADHETGWTYLGRKTYAATSDWQALKTYELAFRLRAGLLTPDYGASDPLLPCLLPPEP